MTIYTWENVRWNKNIWNTSVNTGFSPFLWLIRLLTVTIFCQIWFPIGGFTVRLEDIIIFMLVVTIFLPALKTGVLRYYTNPMNFPLFFFACVLIFGILVTVLSSFDNITKKDAVINGGRLLLALTVFFQVNWHPATIEEKINAVLPTIVLFSFLTTAISLLQMGHWDGWLPFVLPQILTTFKDGANTEQGREIFALYLGNTGSHTWSGALAMQAFLIYLLGYHAVSPWKKGGLWLYFSLLTFILIRISVRNSILGLFIAIFSVTLFRNRNTRRLTLQIVRPLWIVAFVIVLLYTLFVYAPDSYFMERVRQAIPTIENGRLIISRGSNVYGRFEYWHTAVQMFFESPFLGNGFYSYQTLSSSYGTRSVVHAHNSYLQTLAELGLLGISALCLLMGAITYYLIRTYEFCTQKTKVRFWWELTTGSIIFLFFSMIFGNTLWSPNYIVFRMILLGVLASLVRRPTQWLY